MAFTLQNTNWNELTAVDTPSKSANPVFKLIGQPTEILWLKCAPGLQRAAFAGETMNRLGFQANERIISRRSTEVGTIIPLLKRLCTNHTLIAELEKRADQDLLLMANVSGTTYRDHLETLGSQEDKIKDLLQRLGTRAIRTDLAKLIAADLLLGNFDRFGIKVQAPTVSTPTGINPTFHAGNFMLDLSAGARFLPIDNDTLVPSVENIDTRTPKQKMSGELPPPATTEDLYKTVILGGVLYNPDKNGQREFASDLVPSMTAVLGPNAKQAIYLLLVECFREQDFDQKQRDLVQGFADKLIPEIAKQLQVLLGELKRPGSGRQGLNDLMKSYNNLAGMNYNAFKVKCRFADLMVNVKKIDMAEAQKRALAYGKYRDWKPRLAILFAPVEKYGDCLRKSTEALDVGMKDRAGRKFAQAKDKFIPGQTDVELSHRIKKGVRSGKFDESQLLIEYNQLKNLPNTDRAVVKAKTLCSAQLLLFDLTNRRSLLAEVAQYASLDEWVALFYCKAIYKRASELKRVYYELSTEVVTIGKWLADIKDASSLKPDLNSCKVDFYSSMESVLFTAERVIKRQAALTS